MLEADFGEQRVNNFPEIIEVPMGDGRWVTFRSIFPSQFDGSNHAIGQALLGEIQRLGLRGVKLNQWQAFLQSGGSELAQESGVNMIALMLTGAQGNYDRLPKTILYDPGDGTARSVQNWAMNYSHPDVYLFSAS